MSARGLRAAAAALLVAAGPAAAQRPAPQAEPGSELEVELITMGPGDAVWEHFGHNALRITDATDGSDVAYNWGMFSFEDPGFVPRFLSGSMRYWMEGFPTGPTVDLYRSLNRSVWVQRLALTPAQRRAVRDYVRETERPENRYYHYDYFLDNCSTRVRDAIDHALGGQIRAATADSLTATSFRWHTQRLTSVDPVVYAGITLALGQPADRPISVWEEMFLPMRLRDHLRGIRVRDASGAKVPLVADERQVVEATRPDEPSRAPRYVWQYLLAGVAVGAVVLALAAGARRGSSASRRGMIGLGVAWSLLAGLFGVVLLLAWTATHHVFWYRNENLLQVNPLSLLLAITLPLVGGASRGARWARTASLAVAGLSLLGLAVQAVPTFDQVNGEIVALALPVHLAVAAALLRFPRRAA